MVEVLVLHPERSSSSDSLSKTRVVHMVLPVAVTWRGVDETTPKTPLFIKKKKKTIMSTGSAVFWQHPKS